MNRNGRIPNSFSTNFQVFLLPVEPVFSYSGLHYFKELLISASGISIFVLVETFISSKSYFSQ